MAKNSKIKLLMRPASSCFVFSLARRSLQVLMRVRRMYYFVSFNCFKNEPEKEGHQVGPAFQDTSGWTIIRWLVAVTLWLEAQPESFLVSSILKQIAIIW